jgi:signal transduction histidine kinase
MPPSELPLTNAEMRTLLAAVLEVSRNVASTLPLKPLLSLILQQLKTVVNYTGAAITSVEGDHFVFLDYQGPGPRDEILRLRVPLHAPTGHREVAQRRQPVIIADMWVNPPWSGVVEEQLDEAVQNHFRYAYSWLGLPLLVNDELVGVLRLDHTEIGHFTEHDAHLGLAFAEQAAVAIKNARLFAAEQRVAERTHELATLLHVARTVTLTLDIEHLLGLILDQLKTVVAYSAASIMTLDNGMFQTRAYRGPFPEDRALQIRYRPDNQMDEAVLTTQQPYFIPDLHDNSPIARYFQSIAGVGFAALYGQTHAWLRLPLVVKERVIGVLTLHHSTPNYYLSRHIELVMAFAGQAAVAVENASLFEARQRRAEQFRIISEVGQRITSILDVDQLLGQTARLIQEAFGYYHVHIGLIEGELVVFKPAAGVWHNEPQCICCNLVRVRVGQEGLTGRVAAVGEPILVADVSRDPRYIPVAEGQTGSNLVLPLKVKGQVIGVLDVESERISAFDAGDLIVLQSLANQVAVAIENARLYEQAQQLAALQERQKLARELHDSVSQALYGIALGARTARVQLDRDPTQAAEPLDYVLSLAEAGLAEMRALIFELRPESLAAEGLVAALEKLAASLRVRHRLDVQTMFAEEPETSLEIKQALYRIAQEATHNIVKHARAGRVNLRLQQTNEEITLEIRDDGIGFNTREAFPGHLGLPSMRERAERCGGTVAIDSAPGAGTQVRVRVYRRHHPLSPQVQE